MSELDGEELVALVRSAFPRLAGDRALAILVDVPREAARDNPAWAARRRIAVAWRAALAERRAGVPLESVWLVAYADVGSNNANLPREAVLVEAGLPETADGLLAAGSSLPFDEVFRETQILLAPTEYSTTAPLKLEAKRFGFRAATMPGFASSMIPALRLDYGEGADEAPVRAVLNEGDRKDARHVAAPPLTAPLGRTLFERPVQAVRARAGSSPLTHAEVVALWREARRLQAMLAGRSRAKVAASPP